MSAVLSHRSIDQLTDPNLPSIVEARAFDENLSSVRRFGTEFAVIGWFSTDGIFVLVY